MRSLSLLVLLALLLTACADQEAADPAAADDTAATDTDEAVPRLGVVEQPPYGAFISGPDGRPLYLFTADARGDSSACYDACAEAWPPLLSSDEPIAVAPRMEADLLGRIERRDGTMQVTYDGWPLYYFRRDEGAESVQGQDVHSFGGGWYLVSPEGQRIEAEAGGS